MQDEIKVNDGGGLMDSCGMIDSLILDCNNSVKALVEGNYISFCNKMSEMVKKMALLKDGVKKDIQTRDQHIKELEIMLNGGEVSASGPVCDTLDRAVAGGYERLSDVIFAESGGLEADPDHTGT